MQNQNTEIKNNPYKFSKMDEFYTPRIWVQYIIEYLEVKQIINKEMVIWTPFDTNNSFFYQELKSRGYNVINSHKDNQSDFFTYQPPHFDLILSNPPFSNKTNLLKRLLEFGSNKKWCLIFGNQFYQTGSFLRQLTEFDNIQQIAFERRMWFIKDYANDVPPPAQPAFASLLLCNNLNLDQNLVVLKGVSKKQKEVDKSEFQKEKDLYDLIFNDKNNKFQYE